MAFYSKCTKERINPANKSQTCSTFRILGRITFDARKFLQAFSLLMCFHLENACKCCKQEKLCKGKPCTGLSSISGK